MQAATETRDRPRAKDLGSAGEPEAFSIEEGARKSGMGRSLFYDYLTGAREPKLPSFKAGKRRLIRRETHAAWLAKLEQGNG